MPVAEKRRKLSGGIPATKLARPMGRKKKPIPKSVARTPAGMQAAHIERLLAAAKKTPQDLAHELGLDDEAVRKWITAKSSPPINRWPSIAKALGLKDWRDLIPPA